MCLALLVDAVEVGLLLPPAATEPEEEVPHTPETDSPSGTDSDTSPAHRPGVLEDGDMGNGFAGADADAGGFEQEEPRRPGGGGLRGSGGGGGADVNPALPGPRAAPRAVPRPVLLQPGGRAVQRPGRHQGRDQRRPQRLAGPDQRGLLHHQGRLQHAKSRFGDEQTVLRTSKVSR